MNELFANDAAVNDLLILVDGRDEEIGQATKEQAHTQGLLHRAFSVVLRREDGQGRQILLAQRAQGKYHSSGLWANSCCSHPRAGEQVMDAAYRRVPEELGCQARDLREIAGFVYRAEFDNGLCEYEYDHVLVGECVGTPDPDPSEVGDVRWVSEQDLAAELAAHPERFSAWAFTVLSLVLAQD